MAAEEEFDRIGVREDYGTETGRNGRSRDESAVYEGHPAQGARDAMPRGAGSPLPIGSAGRPLSGRSEVQGTRSHLPPPGRALSVPAHSEAEPAPRLPARLEPLHAVHLAERGGLQHRAGRGRSFVAHLERAA